ncbi:restriction endonuclease subunit S [Serratia nevei]|nr:restriction endonuclease subunit S [Serratia nevei]
MVNLVVDKQQPGAAGKGVPTGFKLTEAGVIPKDWYVARLGDVCDLINGRGFKPYEWGFEGLPIIRIQNLNGSDEFNYYNGNYDPKIFIKHGQLLFAWSGSRGTSFGPHIWSGNDALLNYHTWKLLIKTPSLEEGYFYYILKKLTSKIEEKAHGASALVHTQKGEMEQFLIPLPLNKDEQIKIYKSLSSIDALISKLEKLLIKKQAIKTATMQQLLTGKTRLPQFALREDGAAKGYKKSELGDIPEDWQISKIGGLSNVDPENLPSSTPPKYEFDYISLEQIARGILLGKTRLVFSDAPSRARRLLRCNDVMVSTVRPNLKSHYLVDNEVSNLICSTGFSVIRCDMDQLHPNFLYQHLFAASINEQIEMLISGSNYPAINSDNVKGLMVPICSVPEQIAIATILSDMDKDIQTLQQRLDKTRQLKQGMMQELLTGKTRLI